MQFESRFYTSREMYKEYVNKILCRKIIAEGVLLAALAAILCLMGILWDNKVFLVLGVVFLFIAIVTTLLTPKLTLERLLEVDKSLHNGAHPECIVTFGQDVKLVEGKQEVSIEYHQIIGIYRMKTCSVLMFTKQNGIMYVETKFSIGNGENFEKFILDKCPQVAKIWEV